MAKMTKLTALATGLFGLAIIFLLGCWPTHTVWQERR